MLIVCIRTIWMRVNEFINLKVKYQRPFLLLLPRNLLMPLHFALPLSLSPVIYMAWSVNLYMQSPKMNRERMNECVYACRYVWNKQVRLAMSGNGNRNSNILYIITTNNFHFIFFFFSNTYNEGKNPANILYNLDHLFNYSLFLIIYAFCLCLCHRTGQKFYNDNQRNGIFLKALTQIKLQF